MILRNISMISSRKNRLDDPEMIEKDLVIILLFEYLV